MFRTAVVAAGTIVGLYALTVLAVWGIAWTVDLRGDVANPNYPHKPAQPQE